MIEVSSEHGRVLLIDDDEAFQVLMRRQLERAGHDFFAVGEAAEALRAVEETHPDVVLLDYRLPGSSGLELCERLRADERYRFLPIILLSNHTTIELIREAVRVGVNDFLEKGAPVQLLEVRIRAALRTKRLADLAERRYEEVVFLARIGARLNRTLHLDEVLREAGRAAERFRPAALFVVKLDEEGPPTLYAFSGRARTAAALVDDVVERARAALSVHLERAELKVEHIVMAWAAADSKALVGHAPASSGPLRIYIAMQTEAPLEGADLDLFVALAERLAPPLQNALLYRSKQQANEKLSAAFQALAREQAERVAAEKLASVGQLAAGVAHEINNPLAFVISNLNVLQDYVQDLGMLLQLYLEGRHDEAERLGKRIDPRSVLDDLGPLIEETRQGSERVHVIVRKLRGFTQMQGTDAIEEVNLQSVLESVLRILHGELRKRPGLTIERQYHSDVPHVRGDRGRLSQVFLNLVNHVADRVREQEDGRLAIDLLRHNGEVTVRLCDNGPPLSAEAQRRLFEPFGATGDIAIGGFDLAIADEIVRRHGGRIDVRSGEQGAMITVALPARSTIPLPTVQVEPAPPDVPRGHALFIDDERFLLNAYKRAFGRTVDVHVAHGGEEAIKMLQELPRVDVVLCDLVMPRVNGIDVYAWVQEHRPDLLDRFLIVTGGQQGERNREFLDRTGLPVIQKPFRVKEVEEMLLRYMRDAPQ